MNNKQNNAEIKQDLDNSLSGIRFFHEDDGTSVNEITKNILKYSSVSIILRIQAHRELGKIAILLEIEKRLANLSNKLIPKLTLQLKSHLSTSGNEISGDLPSISEHIKHFVSTLYNFCAQTRKDQKTFLCLEFDDKYFVDEFLDFMKSLIGNLPDKLFVYVFVGTNKLRSNTLKYKMEPNYYWDHPTDLGSDLYFLLRNHSSSLIEHLTNNEISLLIRLWSLSDVAIPVGEKALQFLSEYSHQEIGLLLDNQDFRFVINNADMYEAEYKLYRELAFHYANTNKIEKASYCRDMALSAIEKSRISEGAKLKYRGLIWGDYAQFARENLSLSDAIEALMNQKSIYEADKDYFISNLSVTAYNLGICYRASGDYQKAIKELNFSIDAAKRASNLSAEIEALHELGRTYVDLEDYQTALLHFRQIVNFLPEKPNTRLLYIKGTTLAYLVYLNKQLGTPENLALLADKAFEIFSKLGAEEDTTKLQKILRI